MTGYLYIVFCWRVGVHDMPVVGVTSVPTSAGSDCADSRLLRRANSSRTLRVCATLGGRRGRLVTSCSVSAARQPTVVTPRDDIRVESPRALLRTGAWLNPYIIKENKLLGVWYWPHWISKLMNDVIKGSITTNQRRVYRLFQIQLWVLCAFLWVTIHEWRHAVPDRLFFCCWAASAAVLSKTYRATLATGRRRLTHIRRLKHTILFKKRASFCLKYSAI